MTGGQCLKAGTPLRRGGPWLVVLIVLAALNLRPSIVAIGPLTGAIRAGTGLSSSATSLLTTLPLVCLGAFAAVAPKLANRIGLDRAVLLSIVLVLGGVALRTLVPLTALFAGSIVAAAGIALGNVLIPATVKRRFPAHVGPLMAVYSVALQAGATAASSLSAPLSRELGLAWRPTLALWGVLAVLAAAVWLPRAARNRSAERDESGSAKAVWRSSLGWASAGFIGVQSAIYFALAAWLPSLLQDNGLSTGRAGLMLAVLGVAGIAGGLVTPILAARMRVQRTLVLAVVVLFAAGLAALLIDPASLALPSSMLLGLAQGGALALALTLFTLRTDTAQGAAGLSGMAQTAGYLVASAGPLIAGSARSLTGGWDVPLLLLLIALVPLALTGLAIARPRVLENELPTTKEK